MAEPTELLGIAFQQALNSADEPLITHPDINERLTYVVEIVPFDRGRNASGIRVLLACALAKSHKPQLDIRKPYTEIGGEDVFSGRYYDETFITSFVMEHQLPVNHTTAWLTPAWRNNAICLTREVRLVGKPRRMYDDTIALLNDVSENRIEAQILLAEIIRRLIAIRDRKSSQMTALLKELTDQTGRKVNSLSGEDIVTIIEQHLKSRNASRLPVLVVAAAYKVAEDYLGERVLPLSSHNAADSQTGALGDLEITLVDRDEIVTTYEMKNKRVTINDIDHALQKMLRTGRMVDNYMFITTESVPQDVHDYARSMYEKTGGTEVVILDCVSFLRHFIHLFHRVRVEYLDAYQELLLAEPDSAVNSALKRVFLDLRINAQADSG